VPMYILSNMHKHSWKHLVETHDFFSLMKGVVVSCDIGMAKPDHAIYHHLCERFSLLPEECIFIDDMLENIEAARACGWGGEQLTDITNGEVLLDKLIQRA